MLITHNQLTAEEAEDLRYILDDVDMLATVPRKGANDRMLSLWRRLHLWLLSEQGDRTAKMLLDREFPLTPAASPAFRYPDPPQKVAGCNVVAAEE